MINKNEQRNARSRGETLEFIICDSACGCHKSHKISLAANVTERAVTWAETGETRDNEGNNKWEIDSRKNTKKFNRERDNVGIDYKINISLSQAQRTL